MLNPVQPVRGKVYGNTEVVAMLERWVEIAKLGGINYLALVGIVPPSHALTDSCGSIELEHAIPIAIDQLKAQIEHGNVRRIQPLQDTTLDASYVCYNCTRQQLAFDFIVWIVGAEMERAREFAPGPLKIGFWAGDTGELGIDTEYRKQMFEHVVKPSLPLLGAVQDPLAFRGRTRGYRLKEIVDGHARGETIPKFKPTLWAQATVSTWLMPSEEPVVITLREMDAWPHRNSTLEAWLRFADYLRSRGEMVIFVRDTAKATEPLPGYMTCPPASVSLDLRCALYSRAKANLLVSNGPASLLLFMDAPWLMLTQHDPNSEYHPETPHWWHANGLEPGKYPWLRRQREVFSGDSFEEIMEAWDAFSKEL